MRAFVYPATVEEAYPGDFVVRFADIPEAITGGATRDEALANAPEALEVAIEHYLELGRALPEPRSAGLGEIGVPLDPAVAARLLLAAEMAAQGLTKVGLGLRIGRDEKAVRRMLSGRGASLEITLEALRAIGVRPALAV
jgi:antitoxin HicB